MAIEEDDFFVDFSRKDEEENVSLSEQDNEEYFVDFSKAGEQSVDEYTTTTSSAEIDDEYFVDFNPEDVTYVPKRTGAIQEAEPEGILNNLMKGVFYVDRPRASMAGGLTEVFSQIGSGELDLNAIKAEMGEGIRGEDHQMFFDVFKNKILDVKENPENYPMASKLLPAIDTVLSIPNFFVEEGMTRYSDPRKNFAFGLAALLYPTKDDGTPTPFAEKFQSFKEYQSNERSIVDRFTNPDTMGTDKMAFIAGLALDIVIDPVTYTNPILKYTTTAAAITKSGAVAATKFVVPEKILNELVKTSGKTKEQIVKALTTSDLGLSLSKGADFIWGVFSTKHGLTGQQVEWQNRFKNLIAAARVKAIRENEELRDRIAQYSKDTGVSTEEINMFIIEAVERGGIPNVKLENLPKETVALLANDNKLRNEIRNLALKNEDQLALEIKMGVPLTQLGDQVLVNQADEGGELIMFYFNHAITPEAREAAIKNKIKEGVAPSWLNKGDKNWKKVKYWFTPQHSSSLKRRKQWEGLTINDINELAKKGELPGYKGQVFKKGFFYADASIAQALRDFKHHKSIAAATLAGEITKKGGLGISPDDLIREAKALGYKQKTPTPQGAIKFLRESDPDKWGNYVLAENKFTQNYAIPKDTAEFVDTTLKYINDPKKINLFLEKYDWATRWFKSWTLSIFPSYHIRNKVGNLWNNFVIGVEPKAYKDALKYQQGLSAGEDGFILIGKNKMSYKELRDLVEQEAVTGRGLFTADIETSLIAEMGEAKWLTLSADNKAILIGKRVGESIENNARLANFIDGLRKGLSPADAAKRVKKALFDYSDLTPTEQNVFKRFFPFYTWTRKNLPYQLEMLVKHPGKYKAVDTTRMELEARIGEEDPNEKFIGGWMLANYPTKIKLDKEGNPKYFMLGGWWSGADLWKLGSQPTKLATDLLHPILKVMYESTNPDENGYITDLFSGKKLHPDLNMEYLFGWDGNRLNVSETTAHYLNNIRVLSTIDSMIDTYYNVNYPEQKRISAFSRTPTTVEEAWLHFITGVKTFSLDLENNRIFSFKDIENEIQQIIQRKQEAIKRKRPIEELAEYDQQIKELLKKFNESKGFAEGGLVSQMNRLRFNEGGKVKEQPNWFRRKFNKVDSYLNDKIDDFSKTMKADEGFTKYMQHWLIDAPVEASKKLPFIDDETYEYKEPPENATVLENAQTLASNILPSGKDLGKAIVGVATSPIETTDAVLGVTAGALANALPQNWVDTVDSFGASFGLSSSKENQEMASAFGQAIIDDYGTLEDFKNTAIRNPAQVMLDLWAAGTLAKMGYKTAMNKVPKSVEDIPPAMKEKFLATVQNMELPVEKVLDKGVLGFSLAPKKSEIFPTPDGRPLGKKESDEGMYNATELEKNEFFKDINMKQRTFLEGSRKNTPEALMLRFQREIGGGVMSFAMEHAGDFLWRMTTPTGLTGNFEGDSVLFKAENVRSRLENNYGFHTEFLENVYNNIDADDIKIGTKEFTKQLNNAHDIIKSYGEAHNKLPVYNAAQWVAREVPIEIATVASQSLKPYIIKENFDERGNYIGPKPKADYSKAIRLLRALESQTKNNWSSQAGQILKNKEGKPIEFNIDVTNTKLDSTMFEHNLDKLRTFINVDDISGFLLFGDDTGPMKEYKIARDAKEGPKEKLKPFDLEELTSYMGSHKSPNAEGGAPGHNVTLGSEGGVYPDDIYSNKALRLYGTGDANDKKAIDIIQSMKGNPDKEIFIYRAVPEDVNTINSGDWVTLLGSYAKQHSIGNMGGEPAKVISKKVKARDIFTNGDSIMEWGYSPQRSTGLTPSVKEVDDFMDNLVLVKGEGREFGLADKNVAKNVDKDGIYRGKTVIGSDIIISPKWDSWTGKPSKTDFTMGNVGIPEKFQNKRLGKRLYLKMMDELIKKDGERLTGDMMSSDAVRLWKSLLKTTDQDLVDLGFPQLVGVLNFSAPAFELALEEARRDAYLTSKEAFELGPRSKNYDPYEAKELGDGELYLKHYESNTGEIGNVGFGQQYSLEGLTVDEDAALFEVWFNTRKYKENIRDLVNRRADGETIKQYAKGGVVSEYDFKLTTGQWTRLTSWFRTQYTPKLKNKQVYLRSLSPEELENMWTAMLLLDRDIPVNTVAITNDGTPLWFEPQLAKDAVPKSMTVPKPDTTDISHMSDEDVHKAAEIAEQWKQALKTAVKNEPVMGSEKWLQNAAEDIKAGLRSDSFAKKQAKRKEEALLKKSNEQDLSKTGTSTTNSVSQTKEEKPGWKMAKDGNYWSIDTAHKHWQTQKGVDEAKEIFGDKPGWVNNEAFYKKYRRQYADGGLVSPFDGLEQSIIDEIESLDVFNWIKKKAKKKLSKGFDTLGDNPTREQVESLWTNNQKSLGLLAPEIQDRITNTYEDAYDSYFNLDIPTGDTEKLAGASAIAAGGGVLGDWWNKGKNVRIPGEDKASWKTLGKDSLKQVTRSDAAFKAGKTGLSTLRPLKAFTPSMLATGPDPLTRQLVSRSASAISKASPYLSLLNPGTAQAPSPEEMYGVEFGTPEYYSAGVSFSGSLLSNKKDRREDRINRTNKMEELRVKNAQAVAQAKARDEAQAKQESQQKQKTQKQKEKTYSNVTVDNKGSKGYTGQGSQSRAGNRTRTKPTPSRGGSRRNYGVTGKLVTGGR